MKRWIYFLLNRGAPVRLGAVLAGSILAGAVLLPLAGHAAEDVRGSVDPLDVARFPHSWIVGYELDANLRPREYVLGRVDKTRRDVRVEHEVRASATRQWATYEMPSGTQTEEVIDHYLNLIGTTPLFSCRGRDCGRSNLWANEIFKRATLYGPDSNQFYFAGEHEDHLMALYVIERGNKRIYAHLEVLKPESQVALSQQDEVAEQLAGTGNAIIKGVVPARDGHLPQAALTTLAEMADGLRIFRGQTVYVVCHLYGSEDGQVLIERSVACADAAVEVLSSAEGPDLVPFGAGPMMPRSGNSSRLELVMPHRLSHLR